LKQPEEESVESGNGTPATRKRTRGPRLATEKQVRAYVARLMRDVAADRVSLAKARALTNAAKVLLAGFHQEREEVQMDDLERQVEQIKAAHAAADQRRQREDADRTPPFAPASQR
jgi:hypothetical protein